MRLTAVGIVAALVLAADLGASAATVQSATFEDVAKLASVVVIGRVTDSPEFGFEKTYPDGTTVVVREHRFRVTEYLKGDGAPEIVIQTLGGKFKRDINGRPEVLYQVSGGQPQLPDEGCDLLLFLTPFGGENKFMIASAQHGVVRIEVQGSGERVVRMSFTDPEVAPPDVRAALRDSHPEGPGGAISATVPVSVLRELVTKASAAKPRPGRSPHD